MKGIEPLSLVLETIILPLNYTPKTAFPPLATYFSCYALHYEVFLPNIRNLRTLTSNPLRAYAHPRTSHEVCKFRLGLVAPASRF